MTMAYHSHNNVNDLLVWWSQSVTREMSGSEGWFYAGRIGTELKVGITKGCPFCRMNHQRLRPLGLAYSQNCKAHEANMKRYLGTPSHGAEFFSDWKQRFNWMVDRRYIFKLNELTTRIALRSGG